jgi:mannose-6-phosphate isomerase-like protein (cupin superfamily)
MGSLFERLVAAGDSNGALGVSLVTQPPGAATPLHVHHREAEAFFILDGSMTYRAGEDVFKLESGGFIYLPADVPHAFRVTGTTPVRYLALATPGEVLQLYEDIGRPAEHRRLPGVPPSPEEIGRWMETAGRYGIEVLGPPPPAE